MQTYFSWKLAAPSFSLPPQTLEDQPLVWLRNDCANFPMEDAWRKFYVKFTEFRNHYF